MLEEITTYAINSVDFVHKNLGITVINFKDPAFQNLANQLNRSSKEFVFIIGAGMSRPYSIPDWGKLIEKLIEDANDVDGSEQGARKEEFLRSLQSIRDASSYWRKISGLKRLLGEVWRAEK